MFFESHAHYYDKRFDNDRDTLLKEVLPAAGVSHVINAGADYKSSAENIKLAEKYDYIYAAVGTHPHEAKTMNNKTLSDYAEMAKHEKTVAIGEIGLDYHYEFSPKDKQIYWFEKQLELALTLGLPVIIHSREADDETLNILKKYSENVTETNRKRLGVIHCFSSGSDYAKEYVKLGFYIGITGIITYPTAGVLHEVVKNTPLDRLLIETDCPYLAPVPNRGKRNDSSNLIFVAEKIAQIKNTSRIEVENITSKNAFSLFFKNNC